jgi:Rrf2 family protein
LASCRDGVARTRACEAAAVMSAGDFEDRRMKLSRTVEYANQATLQLAQSRTAGPVPCSQLAATSSMPERFFLQIVRSLVTHGILSSTRGVVGGYFLQRAPEDISLLDLVEAIEGPLVGSVPTDFAFFCRRLRQSDLTTLG